MNIAVIGVVSVGKSSFINSFVGYPIATVSLQRETMVPTRYNFISQSYGPETFVEKSTYNETLNLNALMRETGELPELQTKIVNCSHFSIKNVASITDYPGLDDSKDKRDIMGYFIKNLVLYDIVIFVVSAPAALKSESEKRLFDRIKEQVDLQYACGHFCKLICLVTQFEPDDDELNSIYEKNCLILFSKTDVKNSLFRWNSHNCVLQNKINQQYFIEIYGNQWKKVKRSGSKKEPFDFDGFVGHIENFNLKTAGLWCEFEYYLDILLYIDNDEKKTASDQYRSKIQKDQSFIKKIWEWDRRKNYEAINKAVTVYLKNHLAFGSFVRYVILFEKEGLIDANEHILKSLNDFNWWTDVVVTERMKKMKFEDVRLERNNEDFYLSNAPYFDHLYRNWVKFLVKADMTKIVNFKISKVTEPIILDICNKYNEIIVVRNLVDIMRLCPCLFPYPTILCDKPESVPVDYLIEFVLKYFYSKEGINFKKLESLFKPQKYDPEDEAKIINAFYMETGLSSIKQKFPNSWKFIDLSDFKEFAFIKTLITIKGWEYVQIFNCFANTMLNVHNNSEKKDYKGCKEKYLNKLRNYSKLEYPRKFIKYDQRLKEKYGYGLNEETSTSALYQNKILNSPMNSLHLKIKIIEELLILKRFFFNEAFIEYCYGHMCETIPQNIIVKNVTDNYLSPPEKKEKYKIYI